MDLDLPPRLAAVALDQGHVFSTAQALDAGVHPREISRAVRRAEWVRLRRGAYTTRTALAAADESGRHVLLARGVHLGLKAPHVFSHVTAAAVHRLPLHEIDLTDVHVTAPDGGGSARREADVRHHRGEVLPADRTTVGGLPVTGLARTAFDVARIAAPRAALVVADAVLARGVGRPALRRQLDERRDWPGSRRAGRALLLADGRAESPGESLARWAFHSVGLPPDELQLAIHTDAGPFRADVAWTAQRVVGEFDGRVKYGRLVRPGEQAADVAWRERQRELAIERAGWDVVRFTWADVHDLRLVRQRLLEAFARASRRGVAASSA